MGQSLGRPTRIKMLEELKKARGDYFENINSSWQSADMLSTEEYKSVLSESVFVPCPRGNRSVDSFRLYEALEVGSIPIIEKDPYWTNLLGDHPLIEAPPSWENVGADIQLLLDNPSFLNDHQKEVSAWWSLHKKGLKGAISSVYNTPNDQPLASKKNSESTNLPSGLDTESKRIQEEFISLKEHWPVFKDFSFFNYAVEQLDAPDVDPLAFSCYNPGHPIAIVSLYTPEIAAYAEESERSVRSYCEKQGYTFYVYRKTLDPSSHPNWSKPKALLNHIRDHTELIWMDSDTLIFNRDKKFEDILSRCVPIKKIIACEDIGSQNKSSVKGSLFNSGVVIFRSHEYTVNILDRWWNFRLNNDTSSLYSCGGDQEVLIDILRKSDGFGHNRKIFPMNTFNTEPRLINDETFIIHFMAFPYPLKVFFMKYWNNFRFTLPK